jgi:hypothetical protein
VQFQSFLSGGKLNPIITDMVDKLVVERIIKNVDVICTFELSLLEYQKVAVNRISDFEILRIAFHNDAESYCLVSYFKSRNVQPIVHIY